MVLPSGDHTSTSTTAISVMEMITWFATMMHSTFMYGIAISELGMVHPSAAIPITSNMYGSTISR